MTCAGPDYFDNTVCAVNNRWDLLGNYQNEHVDEQLVEQLEQGKTPMPPPKPETKHLPMPRMPPKMSQKIRVITQKIKDRQPISPQQIAKIQQAIKNGNSGLPPLEAGQVWALVDSGSAPHVAPHSLLPNPKPDTTNSKQADFAAANGSPIHNLGSFDGLSNPRRAFEGDHF